MHNVPNSASSTKWGVVSAEMADVVANSNMSRTVSAIRHGQVLHISGPCGVAGCD